MLSTILANMSESLKLKSTAVTNDGSQRPAAYAVLCTDDCTFQVRQVQTSNSVFIMQPTEKQLRSKDNTVPTASLCAIAQCPSLLELIPTTPPSIAFLRQKLPVYNGEQSDDFPPKPTEKLNPWDKVSKCGILEDAALSTGEFDHAWQEICAFEYGSASWIPTPSVLIKVWEAIFVAASVRSLKLDESFSVSAIASMVEELFQPGALVVAVLSRVSAGESVSSDGYARLDRERCVSWIGAVLLESLPGAMLVTDFVKQWQDQLPEVWREHASLEAIKVGLEEASLGLSH